MRESKKKIQAARKDRNYTPRKGQISPSPHPSRSSGSSTDKIKERKKNSTCKECGKKGHWAGDPECESRGSRDHHSRFTVAETRIESGNSGEMDNVGDYVEGEEDHLVFHTLVADNSTKGCGAADSACNRTCSGGRWMDSFIEELDRRGYPHHTHTVH